MVRRVEAGEPGRIEPVDEFVDHELAHVAHEGKVRRFILRQQVET